MEVDQQALDDALAAHAQFLPRFSAPVAAEVR